MHGSRLATIDRVVCLAAPGGGAVLDRLAAHLEPRDVSLTVRDVGEGIDDHSTAGTTLGVTVGGDGTFLTGAQEFAPQSIPFFGVNTGTLGFLARARPDELSTVLDEIFDGRATVSARQRFRIEGPDLETTGLNDVTLELPRPEDPIDRKVCQLDVAVDGEYLGRYEGNGLVVSTPTGSTAMGLSANGPVQFPDGTSTLQVVALHTNRLGVRPVVLDADREIRVVANSPIRVSVDGGRPERTTDAGECFEITGAAQPARLVVTAAHIPYVTALAAKLGWGGRPADGDTSDPVPGEMPDRASHPASAGRPHDETGTEPSSPRGIACEGVRAAGETVRAYQRRLGHVESRPERQRLATEAEQKSREVLETVVGRERSGATVHPADAAVDPKGGSDTWLATSIDGASNFVRGNPHYAVALVLFDGGTPVASGACAPAFGTTFSASQADGAWRADAGPAAIGRSSDSGPGHGAGSEPANDGTVTIGPTDTDRIGDSLLLSAGDPGSGLVARVSRSGGAVRRLGSPALELCFVAAGRADACLVAGISPQEVAPALHVLRVAGGRATRLDGSAYPVGPGNPAESSSLLASNGPLHPALLSIADSDPEAC